MADKIKKFFQKKKADAKFKLAGPGHKLNEEQSSRRQSSLSTPQHVAPRAAPSREASQAAAAALARIGGQKQDHAFNTSLAAIQAQVRRELEAEKKAAEQAVKEATPPPEKIQEEIDSPFLAVRGVFFKCPMIGPEILSKDEWNVKIKEFLYEQLEEERGLTACLMIHTLNKNREKVEACVETLCKYLENIILHPTEEKYRKIRVSNRVFQDKVVPLEGTKDFLIAAGFQLCKLPFQDGEEDFWVFSPENLENPDTLQILCDALQSAEPISLEIDRNLQVLLPSQAAKRIDLPPVFFTITAEELKREQQMRAEMIERSMMLRTKAMREKEEQREMRRYRYALIRIRFPDGILLQGTFSVYEKLEAVHRFLRENLINEDLQYILTTPTGHHLSEEDNEKSLVDLRLVPATILTFAWDPSVLEELGAAQQQMLYLKPEIMLLVQSL